MSADAGQSSWWQGRWAIALIFLAAIATRLVTFGNPLVDMDDQFYWLVGRSWWDGSWPIVDIWDRKPVGLFVIYAAIAAIDRSILAVQLAATLFAAGTAVIIRAAALHIASPRSATLGAIIYLAFLPAFWGQSGQSPVFYNLFIAAAGLLLLKAAPSVDPSAIRRYAFVAMLLSGIALVIKQVSVAEGMFFGLAFLFLLRRCGRPIGEIAGTALAMIAIALLPTLLGVALFMLHDSGSAATYVQASYLSIFAKTPGAGVSVVSGILFLLIFGGPLLVAAVLGLLKRPDDADRLPYRLVAGWMAFAVVGYLLVPNFFPHYALPLLVPLAIMGSRALDGSIGWLLLAAAIASSLMTGRLTNLGENRRATSDFEALAKLIDRARHGGCLYVANGPVGLYTSASHCNVSRFVFPYHLTLATEATAVGVDQSDEIERLFDARPAVVVTKADERGKQTSNVRATIDRHLSADYRLIGRVPRDATNEIRTLRIWQRKDLASR